MAASKTYTPASLNVLAVSSLAAPMRDIAKLYAKRYNISVIFVFDSPSVLATRIENGEAADVYVTDRVDLIEGMKQKGLLDVYSAHGIGNNRLVLAFPKESPMLAKMPQGMDIATALEWFSTRSLFVVGDKEGTALGSYTEEAVKKLGRWAIIKDRIIRAQNNQQAVLLTNANTAAGILYDSDVIAAPELVRIAAFPEGSHEPIAYSSSVVAGENMKEARKFIAFLESPQAMAVFDRYGITR